MPSRQRPRRTERTGRLLPALLVASVLTACGARPPAPPAPQASVTSAVAPPAPSQAIPAAPTPVPVVTPPVRLVANNGAVPILEYHRVGSTDGRWERSYASLAADLQDLYTHGFRPADLSALADAVVPVPPGTHPVVLTFDDGDPSHFTWAAGGTTTPGLDSAAGILWHFHQTHPDWAFAATFFVNKHPFGTDSAAKLRWLVAHGAEVGNHTYDHADLSTLSLADELAEIGKEQAYLAQVLPQYAVVDFAYPYGAVKNWQAIADGAYAGVTWHFKFLTLVAGSPLAAIPATTPANVPRIQVAPPATIDNPNWRQLVWASWEQRWLPTAKLYSVQTAP